MTIAQSDTYPETLAKSRGKTLYRWNVHEVEVVDEPNGSPRTVYEYDEVSVAGTVTKGKILEAMRLAGLESDDGDISEAAAVEEKRQKGKDEVDAADLDTLQKAAKAAKDVAALATVVSDLTLVVARLAESEGRTPVPPIVEVGP